MLSIDARAIVTRTIEDHCIHRGWTLEAVDVRTTHAHTIVRSPGRPPEPVLVQSKAWATRRIREASMLSEDQVVWSEHGSTRYIWHESDVLPAIRYVLEMQDAGGRYKPALCER